MLAVKLAWEISQAMLIRGSRLELAFAHHDEIRANQNDFSWSYLPRS